MTTFDFSTDTTRRRTFNISLSDYYMADFTKKAYLAGMTPEEVIQNFVDDMLGTRIHAGEDNDDRFSRRYFYGNLYAKRDKGRFSAYVADKAMFGDIASEIDFVESMTATRQDAEHPDKTPIIDWREGLFADTINNAQARIEKTYGEYKADMESKGIKPQSMDEAIDDIREYNRRLSLIREDPEI